MRLGREDGVEEEEPSGAGAGIGAGVEEPDPVSSSISCTSSIVISSAIIRFPEKLLSRWSTSVMAVRNIILQKLVLEFYSSLTKDLIGHYMIAH